MKLENIFQKAVKTFVIIMLIVGTIILSAVIGTGLSSFIQDEEIAE